MNNDVYSPIASYEGFMHICVLVRRQSEFVVCIKKKKRMSARPHVGSTRGCNVSEIRWARACYNDYVSVARFAHAHVCALIPRRCGQVIRLWAAVQPRYRSPSDNGSHRRWTQSNLIRRKPFGETLPSGASCHRNDMGDRVALMLLALVASALAAEVGKFVLCQNL